MKNDNIRIKRKSPYVLYGTLSLIVLIAGVLLIALPFLNHITESGMPFYIGGTIISLIGLGGYLFVLIGEIRKPDALVLTNKGFTNYLIGGKDGVYVEWTDIASIKIFGLSKSPSLGLTLEDNDSYLQLLNGRELERASENIAMSLPVIAIPQRCVKLPIAELKALFSKMVKGAISWENYSTQGKKAEPKPEQKPAPIITELPAEPEVLSIAEERSEFARATIPTAKAEQTRENKAVLIEEPEDESAKTMEIPPKSAPSENEIILRMEDDITEQDKRIVAKAAKPAEEKTAENPLDDVILLDLGDD